SIALIALAPLDLGLLSVAAPSFVLVTACGACFPCFQVLALAGHGTEAGTAASITGAANAAVAGIVSGIPGAIGLTSGAPVGLVCSIASVFAILVLWIVVRPRTVPPLGD
ncbi:MAG TPA: Bcr/CflA family drug resistance efflux transporter, partial [Pseudolysinimonas sp.]